MTRSPRPQTTQALLVSKGYGAVRWTHHKYVETRAGQLKDKNGFPVKDGEYWEHIFQCAETGEERRWGMEDRNVTALPPPMEGN